MRFRRAFIVFVASLAAPLVAEAQNQGNARQVDIGYEITFAGLAGFRIDVTARLDGDRYDVETNTFKEGMLRAVTMHYVGRNRAWGGFTANGAQPSAGSLSIAVGDKTRTWLAQYGQGGAMSEKHAPEWKPTPKQVIPDSDRLGSLDPLSAALSVGFAGDGACDRTVKSNDGKRRIDVMIHKIRMEPAAASGIPGALGDVLVCDVYTRRVSGEFEEAAKEAESERERPVRLWLARFDQSQVRYPGKIEATTGFGTIRGKILSFRERPLSTAESQAMRR
jgi:hypothetical protein